MQLKRKGKKTEKSDKSCKLNYLERKAFLQPRYQDPYRVIVKQIPVNSIIKTINECHSQNFADRNLIMCYSVKEKEVLSKVTLIYLVSDTIKDLLGKNVNVSVNDLYNLYNVSHTQVKDVQKLLGKNLQLFVNVPNACMGMCMMMYCKLLALTPLCLQFACGLPSMPQKVEVYSCSGMVNIINASYQTTVKGSGTSLVIGSSVILCESLVGSGVILGVMYVQVILLLILYTWKEVFIKLKLLIKMVIIPEGSIQK